MRQPMRKSRRLTDIALKRRAIRTIAVAAALLAAIIAPAAARSARSGPPTVGSARATGAPVTPTLATMARLGDRRYVAIGTRAYDVGTEDGRYPAMGFHTRGEMGGIWTPPLKLLDGIWFGIDGKWLGPARRFESGYGYTRMTLPDVSIGTQNVRATRVDVVPDGRRAVLVGLELTATRTTARVTLTADAHSELMKAYPWGATSISQTTYNLPDRGAYDGRRLVFTEDGQSPGDTSPHHWAALVGADVAPVGADVAAACETGAPCFRGPQDPPVMCGDASTPDQNRCDDTAYGKGTGGKLRYLLTLQPNRTQTVWFTVAGSDEGLGAARREYALAASDPAGELARKTTDRMGLAAQTRLTLPGDPLLAQGIDWSKQNLADLRQEARNLHLRVTNAGTVYPAPQGTLSAIDFIGAGFPDYPWLFATDGEYTAFASVALGQFGPIEAHLRALRDVSDAVNGRSGKVAHEIVTDGSVYFGANSDPGNTDETVKFPSAVALIWRWTGDKRFLDDMYDFTRRNMRYAFSLDGPDLDNWLDGPGNVERPGMGQEKLDVAVYTIRGLRDLAAMAAAEHDAATQAFAERKAAAMEAAFEGTWWITAPGTPSYADSLADPPLTTTVTIPATSTTSSAMTMTVPVTENTPFYQRYWIGVTPMEAEVWRDGHAAPGLAMPAHALPALGLREQPCFGNADGLFHTGTGPSTGSPTCDTSTSNVPGEEDIYTLNTAIMAVGEGNYGRLGPSGQQRFTTADRRTQLPTPDEQPGAMPEIAPSPAYGRSIDKPFNERAQVLQAWGAYGTAWPVVHQQLGVSPDLGNGTLEVAPQIPPQELGRTIAGRDIRLGNGARAGYIDVSAYADGRTYRTTVHLRTPARLTIGCVLPLGVAPAAVTLDGATARYTGRDSNRGREILVDAGSKAGSRTLVVTTQ